MTPQEIVIPVDSQELADELKSICIKHGLPIWWHRNAFTTVKGFGKAYFSYGTHLQPNCYAIWLCSDYKQILPTKTQINKEQFIELLDNIKK